MKDIELEKLLRCIRDLAAIPYPFPESQAVDSRLILTLGQIHGLASGALDARALKAAQALDEMATRALDAAGKTKQDAPK